MNSHEVNPQPGKPAPTSGLAPDSLLLERAGRLPMLICGVAGVAGYNGLLHFRNKYGAAIIGQRTTNNWPLSGHGIYGIDVDDYDSLRALIAKYNVRSIWNSGGSCALKACELDPAMARRVNVTGVRNILRAIDGTDIRLVHYSIDLVYSGTAGGGHIESDPTDPVTVYGKTMVEAEEMILAEKPGACVLRISLPMGVSFNGHAGAIDWIQSRFAAAKPATLYFDEVRTPTYVECMHDVVEEVMASEIRGLYHAGGTRRLSLYQIAQIVNRMGGYDPRLLRGCPRIEAGPVPPRAGNVTMDSSALAAALGRPPFVPWPYFDWMVPDSDNWHFDRPGIPDEFPLQWLKQFHEEQMKRCVAGKLPLPRREPIHGLTWIPR
ncbi:MAG: sugar nucleotide-binding protein [Planctomycetota bacterium]